MTKNLPSEVTPELVEKFKKALLEFKEPDEPELVARQDISIRQHPCTEIEDYFEWVTRTGKPAISWDIVRPAFLWKVKFVLDEMIRLEKSKLKEGEKIKLDKDTDFKLNFIKERAAEYEGPPFTFQRICELLITPSRHYKRLDKYIRALDKNINVITVITEMGLRITGADWPMPENPTDGKVEQHFFGKVDELDGLTPAGDLQKPTVEVTAIPFGPVLPSALTTPSNELDQEQMEPIDMTKKSEGCNHLNNTEPMESEVPETKTNDAPVQSATEEKAKEAVTPPEAGDALAVDIPLPSSPTLNAQSEAVEVQAEKSKQEESPMDQP